MPHNKNRDRAVTVAALSSVAVSTILLGLKIWAYGQTSSAAVLSSLLDSGIDVLVSLMTFASIRYAIRPPDEDHRYGHGKMEGITALAQGVLLSSGALLLVYEGLSHLINPGPIPNSSIGIWVMVISIILSVALVQFQKYVARKYHSLAIDADRGHYSGDVMINISTIAILVLVPLTGWIWIDPLFALGVSGMMVFMAVQIVRQAMDMLLDREVDSATKHTIARLILNDSTIYRMHDLRVTRHGMRLMVTYDIEMDGTVSLQTAHDIAVASEDRIIAAFPHAEIMVHMDPVGSTHSRRHHVDDSVVLSDLEKQALS